MELPVGGRVDPVISYLIHNAEKHFIPKAVYTKNDWLACKIEPGQTPKRFAQGSPTINWMSPQCKTIVLFLVDESIDK